MCLEQIFDVIRCTFALNGCILIAGEDDMVASNIVIACLMEFEGFYIYNAVTYICRIRKNV